MLPANDIFVFMSNLLSTVHHVCVEMSTSVLVVLIQRPGNFSLAGHSHAWAFLLTLDGCRFLRDVPCISLSSHDESLLVSKDPYIDADSI